MFTVCKKKRKKTLGEVLNHTCTRTEKTVSDIVNVKR